ncbi:MAG: hypothetical protein HRT44_13900 [Bdellovibrionales bacterium]|nr:hypothetical protein [Bdellovibrionales bacterium]
MTTHQNLVFFKSLKITLILLSGFSMPLDASDSSRDKNTNQLSDTFNEALGPQDGIAQSLEPLEDKLCFGQTYRESDVKELLDLIYLDGYPISGLGLFLNFDNEAIAGKKREFRYYSELSKNVSKSEEQITQNVMGLAYQYFKPLGFQERFFELNSDTEKEIRSHVDLPVIFIEGVEASTESVNNFEPYELEYWKALGEEQERLKINKLFQANFVSYTPPPTSDVKGGSFVESEARFSTFDFEEPRYELEGYSGGDKLVWTNMYGFYLDSTPQNGEIKGMSEANVNRISNTLASSVNSIFFGFIPIKEKKTFIQIDTSLLPRGSKEIRKNFKKPTHFDKTLFLSIYKRIKPLNMSKDNFLNAVIEVMSPCMKTAEN